MSPTTLGGVQKDCGVLEPLKEPLVRDTGATTKHGAIKVTPFTEKRWQTIRADACSALQECL